MRSRIVFSRAAARDLRRVTDRSTRIRLLTAIESLAENPNPPDSRKLAGFDGIRRLRVGDYRVCYVREQEKLVILILTVARRADVYERLRRRLGCVLLKPARTRDA